MSVPPDQYFHSIERHSVLPVEVQGYKTHEDELCLEVWADKAVGGQGT